MTTLLDQIDTACRCTRARWCIPEPRVDPAWEVDGFHLPVQFVTRRPLGRPSWLAEEDAWLADRAAREATR